MKKTLIPEDNSIESIRKREQIIRDYYREWKEKNPLQRKYNVALKEYINIRMISIVETSEPDKAWKQEPKAVWKDDHHGVWSRVYRKSKDDSWCQAPHIWKGSILYHSHWKHIN